MYKSYNLKSLSIKYCCTGFPGSNENKGNFDNAFAGEIRFVAG